MANIIKPKTDLRVLDSARLAKPDDPRSNLIATLFNAAAVTVAEHFRTMGWRGHHLNALMSLAQVGSNVLSDHRKEMSLYSVLDGLKFLSRERSRWPEDLTDEHEWAISQAFTAFIVARGIEECGTNLLTVRESDQTRLHQMIETAMLHGRLALAATKIHVSPDPKTLAVDVARCISYESQKSRLSHEDRKFVSGLLTLLTKWLLEHGASKPLTLSDAWDVSRSMYNAADLPIKVGEITAPAITKQRRFNSGETAQRKAFISALTGVTPKIRAALSGDAQARDFMNKIGAAPLLRGDKSQIFLSTCMTIEAYAEFQRTGKYFDVWQTGATWHRRFSDQPLVARANHEMRLFGERGDGVTYGYLTTCEGWQDDVSLAGRRGYGDVEIFWKPEIVRYCTFTIEDSHGAMFTLDGNSGDSIAFATLICSMFHPWTSLRGDPFLARTVRSLTPTLAALAGRFLEFQCHQPLTTNEIESVLIHGKEIA